MEECVFCRVADGDIPSATLYENEEFRVILDVAPAGKGHALILPKQHYKDLYEIPDEVVQRAIVLAKKMITVMTEALECDGFNLIQNNGAAAGQTVFHFHIHLIPRYRDDGLKLNWVPGELTEDVKNDIISRIEDII